MNPNSGHLVNSDLLKIIPERDAYEFVPEELREAARRKLAGQGEAQVSLTSGGKLSRWAASRRKANRKQMAKASRKRNRG